MSYRTQPVGSGPNRKRGAKYREAVAEVRWRAMHGEGCWFRGAYALCPGAWNWGVPSNHGDAFTAHHLHRCMDGGDPEPDASLMAPAHRRCNAWDGLRAQNARRAGKQAGTAGVVPPPQPMMERTSRAW